MDIARWIAFQIYDQNPYIKPPRARTPKSYIHFPWDDPTPEQVQRDAQAYTVTPQEAAALDKIFEQIRKAREEKNG